MPGMGAAGSRGPIERPPSVATAVKLMWAGAALSLLSLLVSVLTAGQLRDKVRTRLEGSGQPLTSDQVDTAVNIGIVVGVVLGIIGVLLWVLMAWANGRGKSWARIVATVLGGLYVLSFASSLVQGQLTTASLIVSVLLLAVDVATLILLWRSESSDFYRASSQPSFA